MMQGASGVSFRSYSPLGSTPSRRAFQAAQHFVVSHDLSPPSGGFFHEHSPPRARRFSPAFPPAWANRPSPARRPPVRAGGGGGGRSGGPRDPYPGGAAARGG